MYMSKHSSDVILCNLHSFCKNLLSDSGVKALADGLMKNPSCILKHLG